MLEQITEYIAEHQKEVVENFCKLVQIPSLACQDDSKMPYGANCAAALDFCQELAEEKQLAVRNMEYRCLEISMGTKSPNAKRLVIAAHADIVDVAEDDNIYPPFGAQIVGDYVVGRGSVDDKGPLIAAMYAFAFFKKYNIPLQNDIRLVVGSNEEMGMDDMEYYLEREGQPDLGLSVDDDFPCVRGEKGIIRFTLTAEKAKDLDFIKTSGVNQRLIHNKAKLSINGKEQELVREDAEDFLLKLLTELPLLKDKDAQEQIRKIAEDKSGTVCKINVSDEPSGSTRINLYSIESKEENLIFSFDVRVPVLTNTDTAAQILEKYFEKSNFKFQIVKNSRGYYIEDNDLILNLLTNLYNETTQSTDEPYVMSGCTYARLFDYGMGFGSGNPHEQKPFPKGHGGAHGADEAHNIPVLLNAIKMNILGIKAIDDYWSNLPESQEELENKIKLAQQKKKQDFLKSDTVKKIMEDYHLEKPLLEQLLSGFDASDFCTVENESHRYPTTKLHSIEILPKKGDGNLSFGMSRAEVDAFLGEPAMTEGEQDEICFYEMKMQDGSVELVYKVSFEENKVKEWTMYDSLAKDIEVKLFGVDVFSEKAEDVIAKLSAHTEVCCDEDRDLTTFAELDALGISLWRESAFHDKLIDTLEYQSLSEENKEYEQQFRYFATLTMKS